MGTHVLVSFFILSFLGSFQNASASSCFTEIYLNDSPATVSVDNVKIEANRPIIECTDYDQKILIEAPGKKPFVRYIPSKSRFNQNEKFWNVHLENILEFPQLHVQRIPSSVFTSETQTINAAPPRSANCSESENNFSDSFEFEVMHGIFVQIEAIAGFKVNPKSIRAANAVSQQKGSGMGIKACPTHLAGTKRAWTKILVGPVRSKREAQALAKSFGEKSFMIVNPLCMKNLIKTSQIEK